MLIVKVDNNMLKKISPLILLAAFAAASAQAQNTDKPAAVYVPLAQAGNTPAPVPTPTPTPTPAPEAAAPPIVMPEAPPSEAAAWPTPESPPASTPTAVVNNPNITAAAKAQKNSPFMAPEPVASTRAAHRQITNIPKPGSTPAPEAATAPAPASAEGAAPPAKDPFVDALALVYSSNPTIKAQREALEATDEGVMQALSGALPSATAEYDRGRERRAFAHQKWNYGDSTDKALVVNQDIFHGGETYASFKAAKDRVKAGQAQLTSVEQQILYNAIVAYTDVVEKQLVLEVNRSNVDVLGKQLDATSARFKVGDITRTDVAQAEARLSAAKAGERQAQGDLDASKATYKRLIGAQPVDRLELPPLPSNLPETLDQADELALAAHPDLKASQHLAKAAENTVDVKTSAIFPDVSLQGVMDRSNSPGTVASGLTAVDTDSVMVNISIPLYQSGAEYSRIREAKNQAQQAKFVALDTRDAVIENVDRSWQDYQTAKAVIISSREALHAADVALEGITQENQSGLRTILDVLDTEQQAFNARLDLVRAQRAEKTQAYRLLAAIGRLTAKDLGLPVALHDPKEHYDNVKYKLIGW